jgi:hypothetical protein
MATTTVRGKKAELIHIEVDRRLGHEWDEWNGKPLPNNGNYSAPPSRFWKFAIATLAAANALLLAVWFILAPRLGSLWDALPNALLLGIIAVAILSWAWLILLILSAHGPAVLLPERLAERGPFLKLMLWTSHVAARFGVRDWVEHASIEVYNTLAARRGRKVGKGELLVLIPRCLSKATLDGVLDVAGRYEVPVFVATRGQLARRAIRERRPRAVVAVACERDMVTGLHDVAGKIPVLGLTMQLPAGPCKDAVIDMQKFESWVQSFVEKPASS